MIIRKYFFIGLTITILMLPICVIGEGAATPGSNTLNWEVNLYPNNSSYIEVKIDTNDFPKNTCFDAVLIQVQFGDAQGRARHQKSFTLHNQPRMKQGSIYVDWLRQPFPDARSVTGKEIRYRFIACGLRFTRLDCPRNVFQKLFGIHKRCDDKTPELNESVLGTQIHNSAPEDIDFKVRGTESTKIKSDRNSAIIQMIPPPH